MNRISIWRLFTRILIIASLTATTSSAAQTVVILLDDSGSMLDTMRSDRRVVKIDAAKSALAKVFEQLPDDSTVGVLALNSTGPNNSWIIPLQPLDRNAVESSVAQIQAEGSTPLGEKMKLAADALLQRRSKTPYGDFRLLIVTDGEAQDQPLVDSYLPQILQRRLTVDVIGVSMNGDHSLATRVDSYRRADNMEALTVAIQEALAETPLSPQDPDQQEGDFELLAGLPDEIAMAAIEALTTDDNRPIGATNESPRVDDLGTNQSTPTTPISNNPTPVNGPDAGGNNSVGTGTIIAAVFLLIVFASMLKGGGKRR